jgi:short-subunit dehydrogenase
LEALRVDLASTSVAVTDVRPGFVRTPMTAGSTLTMPFLVDLDQAIDEITEGIRARAPIVAFPWQLASIVRAGTLVPVRVYDSAVRRIRKKRAQ